MGWGWGLVYRPSSYSSDFEVVFVFVCFFFFVVFFFVCLFFVFVFCVFFFFKCILILLVRRELRCFATALILFVLWLWSAFMIVILPRYGENVSNEHLIIL